MICVSKCRSVEPPQANLEVLEDVEEMDGGFGVSYAPPPIPSFLLNIFPLPYPSTCLKNNPPLIQLMTSYLHPSATEEGFLASKFS